METQSVDMSKKLIEYCKLYMSEWHTVKGFVHDMTLLGIETKYKHLTTYDTMKTDRHKEKKEKEREVFYTSIEEKKNKEKIKKWVFNSEYIPEELDFCKDLVAKFWAVKKGSRSKEAYELLVGHYGLLGIRRKYGLKDGEKAVKEQLEEAIANKWQSITLKNYEAFGRPQKADKEPVTGHPAQRLWKDGGFVE